MSSAQPRGPVDSSRVPRYAGPATFARLPRLDEVGSADVAVVGVPDARWGERGVAFVVPASGRAERDVDPEPL